MNKTVAIKPESSKTKNRLFYVDNLRIFLIALVVLHHLIITYGAPGVISPFEVFITRSTRFGFMLLFG